MFHRLEKLLYALPQWRHNLRSSVNDGFYWDQHVRAWERSGKDSEYPHVGCDWTHQESFLAQLRRYAQPNAVALEIGCGGGRITETAVQLFGHVHAGDVSGEMLRKTRESVTAGNLSLHKLDGFTLNNFPDASLDLVFSHDVFVHFSLLQVYPYLLEIRRVLKPTGVGILSFLDFQTDLERYKQSSLQFWRERRYPPHMRFYWVTTEMLRVLGREAELAVVEISRPDYLLFVFRKPE